MPYNTGNPVGSTDPRDLIDNAADIDALAVSENPSWTDRLGKKRLTWAGIQAAGAGDTSVAVDAAARAETAAANVEADARQIAENAAAAAVADVATAIEGDADRAEAARDAAFGNADVYATITEGRDAVADGEQFQVVALDGRSTVRYRRIDSGSQEIVLELATKSAVEGVDARANPGLLNYFVSAAGNETATGTNNIGLGPAAGENISSGARNLLGGWSAGRDLFGGSDNVALGNLALYQAQGASQNIAIGTGAMTQSTGAVGSNVAVGYNALNTYDLSESTAVGTNALTQATGGPSTAVGAGAGTATTTGARQTIVGTGAQGGAAFNDTIAVGHAAAATASNQIALGTGQQTHIKAIGLDFARWDSSNFNLWFASSGPATLPTGQRNIGIGLNSCKGLTTGSNNLGIGEGALETQASSSNTVAIGVVAAQLATGLADCTYVGVQAGRFQVTGVGDTAVGFRSLEKATMARNNSGLGDSAGWMCQGSGNVFAGYVAAEYKINGDDSIILGRAAGKWRNDGDHCILIGGLAGAITSDAANVNTATGIGATSTGDRVIGIGHKAAEEYLGSDLVAVGHQAARSLVATDASVLNSTFVGNNSGDNALQKTDALNSTAIGAGSYTDRDNQVVLGNEAVEETVLRGVTRHDTYTVAGLPSAATMGAGARAFVLDATAATFNSVATGGGALAVPVFSDGADWRVG